MVRISCADDPSSHWTRNVRIYPASIAVTAQSQRRSDEVCSNTDHLDSTLNKCVDFLRKRPMCVIYEMLHDLRLVPKRNKNKIHFEILSKYVYVLIIVVD